MSSIEADVRLLGQNALMKVGYLRFSGVGRETADAQSTALKAAGCETLFRDDAQSKGAELSKALESLKAGDILVVTKIDRLGKRIKGLVELLNDLQSRSVHFIAIEDGVDTRTTDGAYLVGVIARLVLMDKALVSETTQLSLAIAKAKGRTGGRPPALTEEQKMQASKLISGGMPVRAVAKVIGSNQATLYRLIGAKPV
jgi:DNA invertase Pin-like site-specific DNA recombinase